MRHPFITCHWMQVTAVKAQPQAADRALIADVRRLLRHLPHPAPSSPSQAAGPTSNPTHDPARRSCVRQGASRMRQEPAGGPGAAALDAAERGHAGAAMAASGPAQWPPHELEAAEQGRVGAAAPATVHADWLPHGARQAASRAGVGSLHLHVHDKTASAGGGEGQEPKPQPSAADGGRGARPTAELSSAASDEGMLAAGGLPVQAARPARWLMIISDDADFAPLVRAAATAGWHTVLVGDRPGAGADADARLSWQEVLGPVPQ